MPGTAPAVTAGGVPDGPRERSIGLLAAVALLSALGVLGVAHADALAREGSSGRQLFFWAGLVLICVPAALRLCSTGASERERLGTVLVFGLSLYLVKVAYSPTRLAFSDEFVHLRSTVDDLSTGGLLNFNPLLPEASRYPGLGGLTSGVVRLTGLPIATAALIVIGVARVTLMLALYLLVERVARSTRVAALACLLYAANPNFLYWSAQFSYESLALPLVGFALWLVSRRGDGDSRAAGALALAATVAVVVTHHLSSYFLALVLSLWTGVALVRRGRGVQRPRPFVPALYAIAALAAIAAWLLAVAPVTGQYLGSIASSSGKGLFDVLTGASGTRALFTSGHQVAPLWERALSIAAVLLTLAMLVWGAAVVWRGRRQGHRPLLAALALAALYPLLLPLRFVGGATETANRSTEFVFAGVGVIAALAAFRGALPRRVAGRPRSLLIATAVSVIVLGGVAVAWQYSERLPESRHADGAPYELDAGAIAADRWAKRRLGVGRRFASDFLDHLGLATYGRQRPLWAPTDHASAWEIMAPPAIEAQVSRAVRQGRVEFVLVDDALTRGVPASGFYFDKGEPMAGRWHAPIGAAPLDKFDLAPGVSRVYDNGRQQIYAVGVLG